MYVNDAINLLIPFPPGRALLWTHLPGTSCQATIIESLWDNNHERFELAPVGLKPRAVPYSRFRLCPISPFSYVGQVATKVRH
jgi:hypothetical protein